jgi:hypothetical protein
VKTKMNKKIGIWAGIFVVAMFLLTIVPVNATVVPMERAIQKAIPGVQYTEEPTNFPAQLPPGVSSLTVITARRAFDPWHLRVWDVGYSIWIMRLRDGNPHSWTFNYQMSTKYTQSSQPVVTQIQCDPQTWTTFVFPGFDIIRYSFVSLPPLYYTAELSGTVIKDASPDGYCIEPKYKCFNGFLSSSFNVAELTSMNSVQASLLE